MNIALLNMMPDAALKATDQQFVRLMSNRQDICLHPFTFREISRGAKAADYISKNYLSEKQIKSIAPEALIITGANVSRANLKAQPFWEPLLATMGWSRDNTRSTLCSCLASHAVMQFGFNQQRQPLPKKIWGVFEHEVRMAGHPLAAGLPQVITVPQSRHNEVTEEQFRNAGLDIIIAGSGSGVHLAASGDNSLILMQGHPEYDAVSLLKEYKREVGLYASKVRPDFPPLPNGMLITDGVALLEKHGRMVQQAMVMGMQAPEFPEVEVIEYLHESWKSAANVVFSNWLKLVE